MVDLDFYLTDEGLLELQNEAHTLMKKRPSVRGQTITKHDDPDFWIVKVLIEKIKQYGRN